METLPETLSAVEFIDVSRSLQIVYIHSIIPEACSLAIDHTHAITYSFLPPIHKLIT